jgi:hypothetical protein
MIPPCRKIHTNIPIVTFLDYWQQEIFGFALSSRPFKAKKIHVALDLEN